MSLEEPLQIPELFSGSTTKGGLHGDKLIERDTKSIEPDTYGLRPDELALPEPLPDPHGMNFTDSEIAALEATDTEAAKALAFATATPEKRALLKAGDTE